jgi:hypothetical protein
LKTIVKRAAGVVLVFGALVGCRVAESPPASFSFDEDAGVLWTKGGQTCVELRDTSLAGQTVQFVAASMPQTVGRAQLSARASSCGALFQDTTGFAYYGATIVTGTLDEGLPAIAFARTSPPLTVADSVVALDIDGDGKVDTVRSCTSAEGVHLTVWDGAPPTGRREWHRYVYLGYDLEPTCTDPETKPDGA